MRLLAFLTCVGLPAVSQAAIVSFDPGEGGFTRAEIVNSTEIDGTWRENNGFFVDWTYETPIYDIALPLGEFGPSVSMNDSGCCDGIFKSLEFRRDDGQSFSLTSIDIGQTISSWYAQASFTPTGADGRPDTTRSRSEFLNVAYDNLVLTGTKSDGTAVSTTASTYYDSAILEGTSVPVTNPGDGRLDIMGELAAELSDLDRLRVEIASGMADEDLFRQSFAFSDADPVLELGFEQCVASGQGLRGICRFDGFGEFSFDADNNLQGNYGSQVAFSAFEFSLGGGSPAPVPLPAALPLMALGLGGLGLVRARRTRAA